MNPWSIALSPAIYSAAVIPVLVGTAVAYHTTGSVNGPYLALCLVGLVFIQAWINLSNDVFDAETGVDAHKPWSWVNLTGETQSIFWAGNVFLILGVLAFAGLAWLRQDPLIIGATVIGCILGYSYQGPPWRFAYRGWGELISFMCFGPIAVTLSTYVQTGDWSLISLAASLIVGGLTSLILYSHHFPQIEDDRKAGKFSPIVRWGTKLAAERLVWLLVWVYGLLAIFSLTHIFPLSALLVLLTFPLAWKLYNWVNEFHDQPEKVGQAMSFAVQTHFYSGVLLAIGFLAAPYFMG
jgi:1,4-dihydroxy-2-naphthoate octaprenyltransferase